MSKQSLNTPQIQEGRLPQAIIHFVRILRRAGMALGPSHALLATEAATAVDISDRKQFYWALHATLVSRPDQREIFDQAFQMYWRSSSFLNKLVRIKIPLNDLYTSKEEPKQEVPKRLAEAFSSSDHELKNNPNEFGSDDTHVNLAWSGQEKLKKIDFEDMSADETEAAKRAIARLRLSFPDFPSRRFKVSSRGRLIDMRATLRFQLRSGHDGIHLAKKTIRKRPPRIVAICDISGSMAHYSRMLLHFLHALSNDRERVSSFVFGTRLTNITNQLKNRDVDIALDQVARSVEDWEGGTRIGECLNDFNQKWSRRLLGQTAIVLLITDGLDREEGNTLHSAIERLGKSSRRLIWLNPLLRYDGFEPKARGVRTILPHVDEFRATHNLESLEALASALSSPKTKGNRKCQQTLPN
jgi:uncharacterized protein with von Willebrand factor type A (vWA) domain